MPSLLREPLLHFLVLGALVFAAYGWLSGGSADEIVITRGQQRNLIDTFERTWFRPPTPREFQGLLEDYIRQEIAYREGSSMELDRNDIVIRRRLQQKLELLTEDLATLAPPSEAEIAAYFEANVERYRLDPRYTFDQIYLSTERRGADAEVDALALLGDLRAPGAAADPLAHGDPTALPAFLRDASRFEIAATFGEAFADGLTSLQLHEWAGPIRSSYGLHLVRMSARTDGRIPTLDEVADDVLNDVVFAWRREAVDGLYAELAQRYTIRIAPLTDPADEPVSDRGAPE